MKEKRAFFGTFWQGGLGAIGRCLAVAEHMNAKGFSCYFFAEGLTEELVNEAGFVPVTPPSVAPPASKVRPVYVSEQRVVGDGAVFSNLDEFYSLRGYQDAEYLKRAFDARFRVIETIKPDILFSYWSWETTIAARLLGKPLVTIIQRNLHPDGGGFLKDAIPSSTKSAVRSFNKLLGDLGLPRIDAVEQLMVGDLTLLSGVPSTDPVSTSSRIRHCGPLLWFSNRGNEQLDALPNDRPVAWMYASDDHSWVGGRYLVQELAPALADIGVFVLISSGGHKVPTVKNSQIVCVGLVPGNVAAERADIVVGRGGHDLFWTAIMAGKPFLGAPPNSEWLDYCECARSLGVGDYIDTTQADQKDICAQVHHLISDLETKREIQRLRSEAGECAIQNPIDVVLREV